MPDLGGWPTSDAGDPSAVATATTLSTLGYGLFAWLQPGELDTIQPMRVVTQAVIAEAALATQGGLGDVDHEDAQDAARATGAPAADTLFDEDLAAAQMLEALSPGDPELVEATAVAAPDQETRLEELPPSYSTSRDTIAMLEEIAFLDE